MNIYDLKVNASRRFSVSSSSIAQYENSSSTRLFSQLANIMCIRLQYQIETALKESIPKDYYEKHTS